VISDTAALGAKLVPVTEDMETVPLLLPLIGEMAVTVGGLADVVNVLEL
jgi:hypothetical protein